MKRLFTYIFITLYSLGNLAAENLNLTAKAPTVVSNYSQFRLSYTFNEIGENFEIGEIKDFNIIFGPQQSVENRISYVNGQSSHVKTVTYTYMLEATKEGNFQIPPASILFKGEKYTSNALNIKVTPASSSNQSSSTQNSSSSNSFVNVKGVDVFIQTNVSKKEVYEQEHLLLTFKLYVKGVNLVDFSEMKYPDYKGFIAQEIELPRDRKWIIEKYNNEEYNTITLKQLLLFPQKTGTLNIEEGEFEAILRMQVNTRRSIFDSFFGGYQDVKRKIKTKPLNIQVKSLPKNKPSSFANAVGDFKMDFNVQPLELTENEPISLKIDISGNGNLKLIKNPEIKFPADFESYDPKVNLNIKTTNNGIRGSKTIEYLVIPRHFGKFTIPAVEFTFFDLKTKTYKTLTSKTFDIQVKKGSNTQKGQGYINQESLKVLGKDILYINTDKTKLQAKNKFFFGSFLYYFSLLFPLAIFIFCFFYFRKQIQLNADITYVRNKKAYKKAIRRWKQTNKYLQTEDRENFYDNIAKIIWYYLSDKLIIPLADLTKDNIEEKLIDLEIDEEIIAEIKNILSTCEFSRYAPTKDSLSEMHSMYQQTLDVINQLEEIFKK